MPAPDSELAQQLTCDPYVFGHLSLTAGASERQLEQALMDGPVPQAGDLGLSGAGDENRTRVLSLGS